MSVRVGPEEVQTWFQEHFRERPDIGFWKAVMDLILEPRNPFEPEQRRQPKLGFLVGAGLVAFTLGWLAYCNFTH